MKIIYFLLIALSFTFAKAQSPVIDHLEVDEAKNQLRIQGTFHGTTGSVTIEDTNVQVLMWSDALIVTELPMSGRGAAGYVTVQDQNGSSTKRALSLFVMTLSHPAFYCDPNPAKPWCSRVEERLWYINWRADVGHRDVQKDSIVFFEASRSSYGRRGATGGTLFLTPWCDSLLNLDSTISLNGIMNLSGGTIFFDTAKHYVIPSAGPPFGPPLPTVLYLPLPILFDSSGYLSGYVDTGTAGSSPYKRHWENRLFDQKILFPPAPKSSVRSDKQLFDNVEARIEVGSSYSNLLVTMKKSEAVSFSIYDYLGRRYFHIPKEMLTSGEYSYPINTEMPLIPLFLEITTSEQKVVRKLSVAFGK